MTVPSSTPGRERADACPGALQTHAAADGALARIRLPGGALTAGQLETLAGASRDLCDGALELTSRGNVQLRGLTPGAEQELGDRLAAAGLLPSATHERVRNVVASALSGRRGGHLDARPWVAAFDTGLCRDQELAALPGRFLVTLDDGRGDVSGLAGDIGLHALTGDSVALLLAGADSGLRARPGAAVALLLTAARGFLAERAAQGGAAWRLAELADGPQRVAARLGAEGPPGPGPGGAPPPAAGATLQNDGRTALVVAVPLGRLTAAQAALVAGLAADVQLTPWRSVVVPDLPDASATGALVAAGLVVDPRSPWNRVTACAGRPGCARALADVRGDVTAAVAAGSLPGDGARQHWSGCGRRCGRPPGDVLDVVATVEGYRLGPP